MWHKTFLFPRRNSNQSNYLVFALICAVAVIFHYPYINTFPAFTHAWAQTDRYSLAVGFVRNGFDFFHPETFLINHQFPFLFVSPGKQSITAVDFPIHDYFVGLIMHILGPEYGANFGGAMPWVFRTYTLGFSVVGLYYFYKLSLLVTKSKFKSVLALIFCMSSPVFVFYQSSFLPTIPSLSLTTIALYHYLKYRGFSSVNISNLESKKEEIKPSTLTQETQKNNLKHFIYAISLLTFATLSRTTFAIPLIAIISIELLRFLRFEKIKGNRLTIATKILVVLISGTFIGGFAYHNSLLSTQYGSIFLSSFLPAESWIEVKQIVSKSYHTWIKQYFSKSHYHIATVIISLTIFAKFYLKKQVAIHQKQFLFIVLIITLGCIIFSSLMLKQFVDHDYYFLDSFYFPICLLLVFILSFSPSVSDFLNTTTLKHTIIHGVILVAVAVPLMTKAHKMQKGRRHIHDYDIMYKTVENFKESGKLLTQLQVPDTAKILIISVFSPNTPFVFLNRKGYAINSPHQAHIDLALSWDYDYIIIENDVFAAEIHTVYPGLASQLKKVGDNGKITVYTYDRDIIPLPLNGPVPQ